MVCGGTDGGGEVRPPRLGLGRSENSAASACYRKEGAVGPLISRIRQSSSANATSMCALHVRGKHEVRLASAPADRLPKRLDRISMHLPGR